MPSFGNILNRVGQEVRSSRAAGYFSQETARVGGFFNRVGNSASSRASAVAQGAGQYANNASPLTRGASAVASKAPGVGKSLYKAATSSFGTKAIIGGAAAVGMYNVAARPAMDAAMDVAFDNPDADKEFTGGKLSPLIFGGGAIGGAASGAKLLSPQYADDYAIPLNPGAGVTAGAAIGAGIGGLITRSAKGAAVGGLMGGGAATAGYVRTGKHRGDKAIKTAYSGSRRLDPNTLEHNWDQGPSDPREAYRNSSGRISQQMNSSGDIVLGMHNLRRG
jgi:hypothetical protein